MIRVAVLVLAALAVLTACGGGGEDEPKPGQETPTPEGRTSAPVPELADVPLLSCGPLLTNDDIEEALGLSDRPAGERSSFGLARGESCGEQLAVDERFFVRIEPGAPGDFDPGVGLLGVPGEAVSAVGDDARWFGGAGAEGGGTVGALSVRQSTTLGELHFRIVLGRPDLSSAEQLAEARKVALGALTRFPGAVVTFEREQVDRSDVSFVDNLLVKEAAGEWTLGEGLVATLKLFAGELDEASVLRNSDLLFPEGTGIFAMAYEYLDDGPDVEAKSEISRLLDRLVFSNEQLEAMAGIGQPTAAHPGQLAVGAARGPEEDCLEFFFGEVISGVGPCLEFEFSPLLDDLYAGEYRVFRPASSIPAAGWTEDHYRRALVAMEETVQIYAEMGELPSVNIVFSVAGPGYATAYSQAGEPCGVVLYTKLVGFKPNDFKQVVAHELAHCFQEETFTEQNQVDNETAKWREEGLADFLSNVVYPKNNLEWRTLEKLAAAELATTLFDRSYSNAVFFQHLQNFVGNDGVFDVVRNLPTSGGRPQQEDDLAAYGGIEPLLHTFAQGLTDADIADSGGGSVPYDALADAIPISGPIVLLDDPPRFGVVRLHLVVDPGKYACVEYEENGELRSSWRTGEPGSSGGSWSDDLPESLEGEAVFVVTTTEKGSTFTVSVTDVDDEPECEDEEDEGSVPTPCPLECPPSEYYYRAFGVEKE